MTMRFGVFIPQGWRMDLVGIEPADQWSTMSRLARRAEAGPWESIWVYDHFHTTPTPTDEPTHEAWTLMAAFAASTGRVRLGQMCTCVAYRNPAYLAKVAATIDVISGGRVEMGIGAGWDEHEGRAYGYGFPPAPERLRALDEGVQIMHQAWTTGSATLQGKVYQVDGAIVRPLPLQPGGIPFWIAGGARRSRCGSPRNTRSTPTSTAPRRASGTSRRSWPAIAGDSAAISTRSPARPTTTSRSAGTRGRSRTDSIGSGTTRRS